MSFEWWMGTTKRENLRIMEFFQSFDVVGAFFCREKKVSVIFGNGIAIYSENFHPFQCLSILAEEKYTIFAVWLIAKAAFITFLLKNDFSFLLQFLSCNEVRHVSGITGFLTYLSIACVIKQLILCGLHSSIV